MAEDEEAEVSEGDDYVPLPPAELARKSARYSAEGTAFSGALVGAAIHFQDGPASMAAKRGYLVRGHLRDEPSRSTGLPPVARPPGRSSGGLRDRAWRTTTARGWVSEIRETRSGFPAAVRRARSRVGHYLAAADQPDVGSVGTHRLVGMTEQVEQWGALQVARGRLWLGQPHRRLKALSYGISIEVAGIHCHGGGKEPISRRWTGWGEISSIRVGLTSDPAGPWRSWFGVLGGPFAGIGLEWSTRDAIPPVHWCR